jgi:hypothetical protein
MKNITKVALAGLALLATVGTTKAQSYDVGVSAINSPTAGSTINTVITYPIDIDFTNYSATAIPGGTQVEVHFLANGSPITGSPVTGFALPSAGLAGGATIGFNGLSFRFNIPAVAGPVRICYGVTVVGATDPNHANDTLCATYNVDPNTDVDLGVSALGIVDPVVLPGGTIGANGETITEMTVTITNHGTITYPAGYALPYSLYVQGGTPNTVNAILAADLPPSGTTVRQITNTAIIPFVPEGGPFSLCASVVVTNDIDANNNITCTDYVSAVGIEEVENETALSAIYFNNSSKDLQITFGDHVSGNVTIMITNMAGQTMRELTVNASNQKEYINLGDMANGLYMMNMYTESGQAESQKFVIN